MIEATHEHLVYQLQVAQEALENAQELDRRLYRVPRFSKRLSSSVRQVGGLLDDAEIMQRCGADAYEGDE